MQRELRFATLNVLNLAPAGLRFYDNLEPYTAQEYAARVDWIARQLDRLDADVIGLQEIFSQAALQDVLARTEKYRDAHHLGFEPVPNGGRLSPGVALISRLEPAAPALCHSELPRGLSLPLPGVDDPMTRFTRPVLHARLNGPDGVLVHVFVVHLKSKRPDFRNGESEEKEYGIAQLRSLIRRAGDALGLRYLLSDLAQEQCLPLVVLGDFNDVAAAVSTQLVLGSGKPGPEGGHERLYDSQRIQVAPRLPREAAYTHLHEGLPETIDHILVSEAFHPDAPAALGEVLEVNYVNDHISLREPAASDHGAVLACIRFFDAGERARALAELPPPV